MSSLEKDALCGFDSNRVYELDRLQAKQDRDRLHAAISDHLNKNGIEHKPFVGQNILIQRFIHIEVQNHLVQLWQIIPTFQPPHPHLSILPSDPQLLDKIVQWLDIQTERTQHLVQKLNELTQSS